MYGKDMKGSSSSSISLIKVINPVFDRREV
jgi:hypothetical protein